MPLTSTGVSGAVIEPMRPIIEEKARRLCRYSVGYSSDVKRYNEVNTVEIPNFPNKKMMRRSTVISAYIKKKIKNFKHFHSAFDMFYLKT